ncbi:MAG: glycosyltransferase [Paludibacter sp.]|nr:glycosyltransferase [Paludibacter sp.]
MNSEKDTSIPEVLVITSYPPRECGIATYSQDLILALNNKFGTSFSLKVCAIEPEKESYKYSNDVTLVLNTSEPNNFSELAKKINRNYHTKIVLIQHEFGLFKTHEDDFIRFLNEVKKPKVIVFHTVLPHPNIIIKEQVQSIAKACGALVVMTNNAEELLINEYNIPKSKISVIAHGTHLVQHLNKDFLKAKYGLTGRKVLSTFGLLSSGKSIETTLKALPAIVKENPDVIFLIIGKTHPEVVKNDSEKYRDMLESTVIELGIENQVRFINSYLSLPDLLEYLQLTDIYLFTSNDPNQAVSGTFVYAMSCGCPIISTPIPHAKEVLTKETGIIIDFQDSMKLAESVILLLNDEPLRKSISTNTLQKIVTSAWENSAVAHAKLLAKQTKNKLEISYTLPELKLDHFEKMTTDFGMIQFSKINQPDFHSGYTLDDNARALIALVMHYEAAKDENDLLPIQTYLNFIKYCQKPSGSFLNYIDINEVFTEQNNTVNLDDANGRAIWALGFFISRKSILPNEMVLVAMDILQLALPRLETVHSARAMAFIIKGLYFYNKEFKTRENVKLVELLAERMVVMYMNESEKNWEWFESYLTYANSILPEAMLYSWQITGNLLYKGIARESLDFLLLNIFNKNGIEVVSNRSRFNKGEIAPKYGEQPIDVAYTIMTLSEFYKEFKDKEYLNKLFTAFNWFLGENRLHQIVYNPCTGGCFDGLEKNNVNLNQGAESTISYQLARITIEDYIT